MQSLDLLHSGVTLADSQMCHPLSIMYASIPPKAPNEVADLAEYIESKMVPVSERKIVEHKMQELKHSPTRLSQIVELASCILSSETAPSRSQYLCIILRERPPCSIGLTSLWSAGSRRKAE